MSVSSFISGFFGILAYVKDVFLTPSTSLFSDFVLLSVSIFGVVITTRLVMEVIG